jgi:hypothetical protein
MCLTNGETAHPLLLESHSGKAHKPTPPPTQHHSQPPIPKAAKPTGSFSNPPQKVDPSFPQICGQFLTLCHSRRLVPTLQFLK